MSRSDAPPTPVKAPKFNAMVPARFKKAGFGNHKNNPEQLRGTTMLQIMDRERWDRERIALERDHLRAENQRLRTELIEAKTSRDKWQDAYEKTNRTSSKDHREFVAMLHSFRSELSGLRMDLFYRSGERSKMPLPLSNATPGRSNPVFPVTREHPLESASYKSNESDSPTLRHF